MAYHRAKCSYKATTKTQTCTSTIIQQKGKKPDLFVLVFIQQIEASPKADIHQRITRKIACVNQKTSSQGVHPSRETLRRVEQMHNVLSHKSCFKMKTRRSIHMISHSLFTKYLGLCAFKICQLKMSTEN